MASNNRDSEEHTKHARDMKCAFLEALEFEEKGSVPGGKGKKGRAKRAPAKRMERTVLAPLNAEQAVDAVQVADPVDVLGKSAFPLSSLS
jgi:hypothetical protein